MSSDMDRTAPPVEILLVEDNLGDARLTREALKEGKVYNNLHWVKDGVEALDFRTSAASTRMRPSPTSSCSTSTFRRRTDARSCRRSSPTRG